MSRSKRKVEVVYFCARTKPNLELLAKKQLENQGVEAYLPMLLERGKVIPLFRPYIFIKKPLSGQWRFILSTRGIQTLVFNGSEPATIKESILRKFMDEEGEDGYIIPPDPVPKQQSRKKQFEVGEKIKVLHDSFLGHLGVYQGMTSTGKERILMKLFNRDLELELENSQLEKSDEKNKQE